MQVIDENANDEFVDSLGWYELNKGFVDVWSEYEANEEFDDMWVQSNDDNEEVVFK